MMTHSQPRPAGPAPAPAILALDSGSPTVSVAVARQGRTLVEQVVEIGRSSQRLLPMIDDALADAGVGAGELAGIVALAGPGSFTGLRVGLATALGLHQALAVPAAAVPTLEALAGSLPVEGEDGVAGDGAGAEGEEEDVGSGRIAAEGTAGDAVEAPAHGERRVVALVDVLRDEWACQEFRINGGPPRALGGPERLPVDRLEERFAGSGRGGGRTGGARRGSAGPGGEAAADNEPVWLVGFGVGALEARLGAAIREGRIRLHEPRALAATAARAATLRPPAWDAASLTHPLYFRPPAVTLPKKR